MVKFKGWHQIDVPWIEMENFSDLVLSKINIIDLLDIFKIEYQACRTGDFTHKMRCPFHADGGERTPSMYVSQDTNSFYCFGCNMSGTAIDFVMRFLGTPYFKALEWMASLLGISSSENLDKFLLDIPKKAKRDPEKTVIFYVFKTGEMVRNYLTSIKHQDDYSKKLIWADRKVFPKLDTFLDEVSDDDWEKSREFYLKIKNIIGEQ